MYSRGQGRIGSSGFEHVFLAELKNNQVSGLHNWLYFNEEEKNRRANYLGYMKKIDLGNVSYVQVASPSIFQVKQNLSSENMSNRIALLYNCS